MSDRCPHCSFSPESLSDYCDKHRPVLTSAASPPVLPPGWLDEAVKLAGKCELAYHDWQDSDDFEDDVQRLFDAMNAARAELRAHLMLATGEAK